LIYNNMMGFIPCHISYITSTIRMNQLTLTYLKIILLLTNAFFGKNLQPYHFPNYFPQFTMIFAVFITIISIYFSMIFNYSVARRPLHFFNMLECLNCFRLAFGFVKYRVYTLTIFLVFKIIHKFVVSDWNKLSRVATRRPVWVSVEFTKFQNLQVTFTIKMFVKLNHKLFVPRNTPRNQM
ncbi:hypothetical protein L9F63_007322, partial [Diploptera punctata]